MDPVFATMLDAVRIVTFQYDPDSTTARRSAREAELESRGAAAADEPVPAAGGNPDAFVRGSWFRSCLAHVLWRRMSA